MPDFLQLDDLDYAYPDRNGVLHEVLQGVRLQLAAGEIHCLIGRSASGKTTLLKLAAGLLQPQRGQVRMRGQLLQSPMTDMGFVFQAPTLLHWLTVSDNILLPLRLHRSVSPNDRQQAAHLLSQLGLPDLSKAYPDQLSGGQQSRVALARALIVRPSVLFMDEPFAALDALTREELQCDFSNLCRAQGISVLFVTHDIGEAVFLGDRVSLIESGSLRPALPIGLPRPRATALRHAPEFNALCADLRHALQGAH